MTVEERKRNENVYSTRDWDMAWSTFNTTFSYPKISFVHFSLFQKLELISSRWLRGAEKEWKRKCDAEQRQLLYLLTHKLSNSNWIRISDVIKGKQKHWHSRVTSRILYCRALFLRKISVFPFAARKRCEFKCKAMLPNAQTATKSRNAFYTINQIKARTLISVSREQFLITI